MEKKEAKRLDRFSQFAIAASRQAIDDAKFVIDELNADRVGVLIGTGVGGIQSYGRLKKQYCTAPKVREKLARLPFR